MLVDKSTAVVEHCCLLRSLPMKKRGGGRPCFDSLAGRWERRCGDRRRSLSLPFAPIPRLTGRAYEATPSYRLQLSCLDCLRRRGPGRYDRPVVDHWGPRATGVPRVSLYIEPISIMRKCEVDGIVDISA
jgi:hypothetical protein